MKLLPALALAFGLAASSAYAQPVTAPNQAPPMAGAVPGTPMRQMPPRTSAPAVRSTGMQAYSTEAQAQQACAGDTVVWGNTSSHVLHAAGSAYYGHTKRGAYMCQRTAMAGGYHMSKNGN